MDLVVLVDEDGNAVGTEEKLAAHRPPGLLHLAFSVFLFDDERRTLLQRRADAKHHFAGLWSNTCCSHPRPGEDVVAAGERRLGEELGVAAALNGVGSFVYRAEDDGSGLVEHEFDHVLVGRFDGYPQPDPSEVSDWRWIPLDDLTTDLAARPGRYTPWLAAALHLAAR